MSKCDSCASDRVFKVGGKSSDCNNWTYKGREGNGYLPDVNSVCGGDYYDFSVCLQCGKVQGQFPVECEELERDPAAIARQHFLDNFGNNIGKFYSLGVVNPTELQDIQGVAFGDRLTRWDRDVYGFLVEFSLSEYIYVFIDPEWNCDMCQLRHFRPPHEAGVDKQVIDVAEEIE